MKHVGLFLFLLVSSLALAQQQVKLYPGAKTDDAGTSEARVVMASQPGVEISVFVTNDSFDKVYAYYKKNAKEYKMIGARARKLPTGQELKDAFFILDDAADLVSSKRWVKIQRPYIGQFGLAKTGAKKEDVRDVTAIVVTKSK